MLSKLIALVLTGTVTLGGAPFFADLTDAQIKDLENARIAAVEVLSEAEVDFISSLEGLEMSELTVEQREDLRDIRHKLGEAAHENIEDEELKALMEERHEQRHNEAGTGMGYRNGSGNGQGLHRNE